MEQTNRMPLQGIRVIDLTIWVQGPTAASVCYWNSERISWGVPGSSSASCQARLI